jgi:hypothetical protein
MKWMEASYQVITQRKCKQSVSVPINSSHVWRMAANMSYVPNGDITARKVTFLVQNRLKKLTSSEGKNCKT